MQSRVYMYEKQLQRAESAVRAWRDLIGLGENAVRSYQKRCERGKRIVRTQTSVNAMDVV